MLLESLSQGIPNQAKQAQKKLIESGLIQKTAVKYFSPPDQEFGTVKFWSWMEFHNILETIFKNQLNGVAYELATILKKKYRPLPINCIQNAMDLATKSELIASAIIPIVGEAGHAYCKIFDRYRDLSFLQWNQSLPERIETKGIEFFLSQWRIYFPEDFFEHFKKSLTLNNEKTKLQWLKALQFIRQEEVEFFKLEINQSLKKYQMDILRVNLSPNSNTDWKNELKSELNEQIQKTEISFSSFPLSFKKTQLLDHIPLDLIDEKAIVVDHIKALLSNKKSKDLFKRIKNSKDEQTSVLCLKLMIDEHLLEENMEFAWLADCMSHTAFNEIALYWLKKHKEQTNLECVFQFMNSDKHFWNDELAEEIMLLEQYKSLTDLYEFSVFYSRFSTKLNPNGRLISTLTNKYKLEPIKSISFDLMVFFRRQLRLLQ